MFSNPCDRSTDELLDAVRRGHSELVPVLVSEWRQNIPRDWHFGKRHRRYRPGDAGKILAGLASIDNIEVASRILASAASVSFPMSFERRHLDEWEIDGDLCKTELFAPLFWRLPVEAVHDYLHRQTHPGWSPCFAGLQLLSEELMGLQYDPIRRLLGEADMNSANLSEVFASDEMDDERMFHILNRRYVEPGWLSLNRRLPPRLLWEKQLHKEPYWTGEEDDINAEVLDSVRELLATESKLRKYIKEKIKNGNLVTDGLLGRYDANAGRIDLYPAILEAVALQLGLQPRFVKSVVFVQLSVRLLGNEGRDLDGQPGFGFSSTITPLRAESPAQIMVCQYFTFQLIERLGDQNLLGAFEKLSDNQPEPYRRWRRMKHIPVEQMRTALLRMRLGESALGLPSFESEG